jgi:hypothetical protein
MTDLSRSGVGVEPQPTEQLWAAVAKLTQPTRVMLARDEEDAAWIYELDGSCSVAAYRAATGRWAEVPSLWQQSVDALTNGSEGGLGSKPLRERSPADLDLMEIRSIIRGTTRHELERLGCKTARGKNGERVPFDQKEMRSLASLVIAKEPDELWWWTYRFESWGRLLEGHLQAVERKAKPMRLRNSACPACSAKQVTIEGEDGPIVVPALVVDFTSDGYARACECLACGHAWFRGEQMEELASDLGCKLAG